MGQVSTEVLVAVTLLKPGANINFTETPGPEFGQAT